MSRRRLSRGKVVTEHVPTIWDILQEERKTVSSKVTPPAPQLSEEKIGTEIENQSENLPSTKSENQKGPYLTQKTNSKESFLLFVGEPQSGKTTVIQNFLHPNKESDAKPTNALDYTYGRRANATGDRKDLAHIWELGGGKKTVDLLQVVITKSRLSRMTFVLTADLSKPEESIHSLVSFIALLKEQVRSVLATVRSEEEFQEIEEAIQDRRKTALGNSNPELETGGQLAVPMIILATKYDVLRDEDGLKRKSLGEALRYIAWAADASLIYVSKRDKATLALARGALNHCAFETDLKKAKQLEGEKPLYVVAGSDSLEAIKLPPGARLEDFKDPAKRLSGPSLTVWSDNVSEYFPPSHEEGKRDGDESKEPVDGELDLAPEPIVDAARARKDRELESYKQKRERQQRLKEREEKE